MTAAPETELGYETPQIRCEWSARPRVDGGWTLIFELGRVLRVCRLVCIVNIPDEVRKYSRGEAFIRFHIDRTAEDPPTGRRPR